MLDPQEVHSPEGSRRIGPWSVLASREIYANPWISVREDRILHPNGEPGIYGVVSYRNLAVGVVAIDEAGDVILVGQHRYPFDAYSWEIPEGGCPAGREMPLQAARRELKEEAGIVAARFDYLGCLALSNSVSDEVAHLFLARELTQGASEPDASEVIAIRKMDFQEACRQAEAGEMNESISVAALLRARYWLQCESAGLPMPRYRETP